MHTDKEKEESERKINDSCIITVDDLEEYEQHQRINTYPKKSVGGINGVREKEHYFVTKSYKDFLTNTASTTIPGLAQNTQTPNRYLQNIYGTLPQRYNPDMEPIQNVVLRHDLIYVEEPWVREALLTYSPYLNKHTFELLSKIIRYGWKYKKPETESENADAGNALYQQTDNILNMTPVQGAGPENPTSEQPLNDSDAKGLLYKGLTENDPNDISKEFDPWSFELNQSFIDLMSKALVIDTAYLCQMGEADKSKNVKERYYVFTSNDVNEIYVQKDTRKIVEVYFNLPAWGGVRYQGTRDEVDHAVIGFLTQYSEDKEISKNKISYSTPNDPELNKANEGKLMRKSVVVTPLPSHKNVHGEPRLIIECQTGLEKLALRFYEMLFCHKGGNNRTIVLPQSSSMNPTDKAKLINAVKRGILDRGYILYVNPTAQQSVTSSTIVQEKPIPHIPFDIINTHLSEEAKLSKQGIEGSAEANNLSGTASIVNLMTDRETIELFHNSCREAIKDINYVFFDKKPDTYDIEFNNPDMLHLEKGVEQRMGLMEDAKEEIRASPVEKISKDKKHGIEEPSMLENIGMGVMRMFDNALSPTEIQEPKLGPILHKNPIDIDRPDTSVILKEHSAQDKYVVFKGNMLRPGTYVYHDVGEDPEFISRAEIKDFTDNDVSQGYLDINHQHTDTFKQFIVANEGYGFYRVIGYDPVNGIDTTLFYIKLEVWRQMGKPHKINLSPNFMLQDIGGKKKIVVYMCSILTAEMTSRAEMSGLGETSAVLIREPGTRSQLWDITP